MKKIILLFLIPFLVSCGAETNVNQETNTTPEEQVEDVQDDPAPILKDCIVTLDNVGGEGEVTSFSVKYGERLPNITYPTKEGYFFTGYTVDVESVNFVFYSLESNSLKTWPFDIAEITLHARWYEESYRTKITLDYDGGTCLASNVVYAKYGEKLPDVEVPTKRAYAFEGFYDENNKLIYNTNGKSSKTWNSLVEEMPLKAKYRLDATGLTTEIIFDKNGGTGGTDSIVVEYGSSGIHISIPTQENKLFVGYFIDTSEKAEMYFDKYGYLIKKWDDIDETITLYAQWSSLSVTLYFENGIDCTPRYSRDEVEMGDTSYRAEIPVYNKKGYVFGGYYTNINGEGTKVINENGEIIDFSFFNIPPGTSYTTVTLYPYFIDKTCTIYITDGERTTRYYTYYGGKLDSNVYVEQIYGYYFVGIFDEDGKQYFDNKGKPVVEFWDKDVRECTLYFKYEQKERLCTITFDNDGGTGGPNPIDCYAGDSPSFSSKPTRDQCIFAGYYTEPDGKGQLIFSSYGSYYGDESMFEKDFVVYAFWKHDTIVYLDNNGGTGIDSITLYTNQNSSRIDIKIPTKDYNHFIGYFTSLDDDAEMVFDKNGHLVADEWYSREFEVTYYAKYTHYTVVTLNKNNDSSDSASKEYIEIGYTKIYSIPTFKDHTFIGWFDSDGNQISDASGLLLEPWSSNEDEVTLTAHWELIIYDTHIRLTGGMFNLSDQEQTIVAHYGQPMEKVNVPVHDDVIFNGFYASKDKDSKQYFDKDGNPTCICDFNSEETVYLYAHWINKSYTVTITFDAQGGTYDKTTAKIRSGENWPYSNNGPTKENYLFTGWYDQPEGGNLISGTFICEDFNMTVYAHYKSDALVAYFDCDGGTEIDPITYHYNKSYTLPTPVKEGYIFMGWCNDSGYKRPIEEITVTGLGEIHYLACWVKLIVEDVTNGLIIEEPLDFEITYECKLKFTVEISNSYFDLGMTFNLYDEFEGNYYYGGAISLYEKGSETEIRKTYKCTNMWTQGESGFLNCTPNVTETFYISIDEPIADFHFYLQKPSNKIGDGEDYYFYK